MIIYMCIVQCRICSNSIRHLKNHNRMLIFLLSFISTSFSLKNKMSVRTSFKVSNLLKSIITQSDEILSLKVWNSPNTISFFLTTYYYILFACRWGLFYWEEKNISGATYAILVYKLLWIFLSKLYDLRKN